MQDFPHPLSRRDLLDMEGALCARLATLLPFTGHALYFPTEHAPDAPRLLPREHRLLLPLRRGADLLGVLMLHGVRVREARPLLPHLPALSALCLDNLALTRALRTDRTSGLATEEELFARMEAAATNVRDWLEAPAAPGGGPAPLPRLCLGLALLRVGNGPEVARLGHDLALRYWRALADACRAGLPPDVTAARVGRWEIGLLIPTEGRGACQSLTEAALARMAAVRVDDPVLREPVRLRLCAGHVLYPQDMLGAELALDMADQARRCMDRARLAADVAQGGAAGRVMPFASILHEGGVVLERLPMGRLRLSLGRRAKAREGMRFAVWAADGPETPRSLGVVVVLQTGETDAVAEILHMADAAREPQPGDRLSLLDAAPPADAASGEHGGERSLWPEPSATVEEVTAQAGDLARTAAAPPAPTGTGVRGHGEFLRRFTQAAARCRRFTLALLRLDAAEPSPAGNAPQETALEHWRATVTARLSEAGQEAPTAGLYGSNSLIFFHPGAEANALAPLYADLCDALRRQGLDAATGLAGYPFLHFRRGDMPDCVLKALEYARLLPPPHVGVCDSLALNISADKRYSLGDMLGAIEEYKLALLADRDNVMARNSLGVCMAALGRNNEALRCFLNALRRGPDTATRLQICYNLGTVCQSLGKRRAAARHYRQCVALKPDHLFAHIRLGQICESGGRRADARRWYEKAAALEDATPGSHGIARRCLARVAARQRRGREARELLHETLLRNPDDADALLLLANIYLDGNEDPAVAETLARKSAALRGRPDAWRTLARALRCLGREEEARNAEARAV